jgi:hypothetical protein
MTKASVAASLRRRQMFTAVTPVRRGGRYYPAGAGRATSSRIGWRGRRRGLGGVRLLA